MRKERIELDRPATRFDIHGVHVIHEEHDMRVAHPHGHRITVQRQMRGVHRLGQRDLVPHRLGMAHIHMNLALHQTRLEHPACRADRERVFPGLVEQIPRHAAGRVAAGPGPAAVAVPEVEVDVGRITVANPASWSNPTPRCRSPSPRARASVVTAGRPRESKITKSFPAPCHFMKGRPVSVGRSLMTRIYAS